MWKSPSSVFLSLHTVGVCVWIQHLRFTNKVRTFCGVLRTWEAHTAHVCVCVCVCQSVCVASFSRNRTSPHVHAASLAQFLWIRSEDPVLVLPPESQECGEDEEVVSVGCARACVHEPACTSLPALQAPTHLKLVSVQLVPTRLAFLMPSSGGKPRSTPDLPRFGWFLRLAVSG